jgi:hypothetical protein
MARTAERRTAAGALLPAVILSGALASRGGSGSNTKTETGTPPGETGTAPPPENNPTNPAPHQKHRRKRR